MFPDMSRVHATPPILNISTKRSQFLVGHSFKAVCEGKAHRLDRLLGLSRNPNVFCAVQLARDLDKQWRINTVDLKTLRMGWCVPTTHCWLSLLEIASLLPVPSPEVVGVLIKRGVKFSNLSMEVVLVRLEMKLERLTLESRRIPFVKTKLLSDIVQVFLDNEAPLHRIRLPPPPHTLSSRKVWASGNELAYDLLERVASTA